MKNLFYKLKKNRDGMTLVELLVAFTLLVLIVFVFSPMLLYSFGNLQLAGEKYVGTYNSKSVLEKRLSIREKDNYYGEGIKLSFENLSNNIVVHAKQVASDVAGLETLYAPIQREVKIAGGSNELNDNTSTFSVFFDFANINTSKIEKGTTHKENTIVVDVTSLVQKEKINLDYTVRAASGDENRALVEIKNCDITYSPLQMDIYYYNDNGLKRQATKYIYISPADMMFVGDATTSNQYITSAGVDEEGKLLLSARTFVDSTLGTGGVFPAKDEQERQVKNTKGTFNSVKWVPNANGTGDGGYVMVGANGLVRRLWHLSSADKDAQNLIFNKERYAKIGDTTYWKYTWGSDYINADVAIENQDQDKKDKFVFTDLSVNNIANYNGTGSVVYFSSNFKDSGSDVEFMRPLSKVITATIPGEDGTQAPSITSMGFFSNWVNYTSGDTKWYEGAGWCNYYPKFWPTAKYGTNLASNYYNHLTHFKNNNLNPSDFVPIVFFSSDGNINHIDRAYVPRNNYWGSYTEKANSGTGLWYPGRINRVWPFKSEDEQYSNANTAGLRDGLTLWTGYAEYGSNNSATFKLFNGCPPYFVDHLLGGDRIENYHNQYSSGVSGDFISYFLSDCSTAWTTKWSDYGDDWPYRHWGCSLCDVAPEFSNPVYSYNAATSSYTYYEYDPNKTWQENQQTVIAFLKSMFNVVEGAQKTILPHLETAYPVTANTALTKNSKTYDAGYMRLVAYSNASLSFGSTSNSTIDVYLNYNGSAAENDTFQEVLVSNACKEAELTDFFYDDYGNVTYVGITPVAATVMGPEITGSNPHSDLKKTTYKMYVVASNGKNGYTIKQYNNRTDADYASVNTSTANPSAAGSGNASFTLGYASNYEAVFGNLNRYLNTGLFSGSDRTKPQNVTTASASVDADYPDRFMSFLSYTTSGDYTFGAGYRVSGTVGLTGNRYTDCICTQEKGITINDLFKEAVSDDEYGFSPIASYGNSNPVYCCTVPEGGTTAVNKDGSVTDNPSLRGYFFHLTKDDNNQYTNVITLVDKSCTCTASFTSFADLSRAVTNKGVIEYKKNGSDNFSLLQYSIEGGAKENFKFTSINAIKQENSYLIIVGAEYTDNTGTHAALYKGTSAEASGVLDHVTLTPVAGVEEAFNSIKSVYSTAKEDAYAIIASGEAKTGAKVLVSQDSGATWSTVMVTGASHTYCINDIASNGDDYIYAVGSSSGKGGIVCYAALSSLNTWNGVTTCYGSIKCNDDGTYSGESGSTLPNLYSVSSKNA